MIQLSKRNFKFYLLRNFDFEKWIQMKFWKMFIMQMQMIKKNQNMKKNLKKIILQSMILKNYCKNFCRDDCKWNKGSWLIIALF